MDRSAPTTRGGGDSEKWMGGNSWDGNVSGASASRDSGFEEDALRLLWSGVQNEDAFSSYDMRSAN